MEQVEFFCPALCKRRTDHQEQDGQRQKGDHDLQEYGGVFMHSFFDPGSVPEAMKFHVVLPRSRLYFAPGSFKNLAALLYRISRFCSLVRKGASSKALIEALMTPDHCIRSEPYLKCLEKSVSITRLR